MTTFVTPTGNALPLVWLGVMVTEPGQLSEAVGAVQEASPVQLSGIALEVTVVFDGQPESTGACVSFTVTVKVQASVLRPKSVAK